MPNWCDTDITFKSKKRWKLEKLKDKLMSKKNKPIHFGNLQLFDTLSNIREIVKGILVINDKDFDKCMQYMYKNLLYADFGYFGGEITSDDIINIFEKVDEVMNGKRTLPFKDHYNVFRMYSLIKPNDYINYSDGYPISKYLNEKEIKEIQNKYDIPDGYWEWIHKNIGIKWDIDLWSENGEDDIEIEFNENSGFFEIRVWGGTAWSYPDIFISKVCKKYKITADLSYVEEGMCFAGKKHFTKKGEIIDEVEIDDDEFFSINANREIRDLDDFTILEEEMEYYEDALSSMDEEEVSVMKDRLEYLMDTTKDKDVEIIIRKKLDKPKHIFKNKKQKAI